MNLKMDDNIPVTILVVDDDDVDAKGIERAFRKAKIANPIERADSGVEALEILRGEHPDITLRTPYLLLVDLNMPRMSGLELIKEMREDSKLRSTIAFVLTTSKAEEDKEAAYGLNIAGYIVKEKVGQDFVKLVNMVEHYWKVIEFPVGE